MQEQELELQAVIGFKGTVQSSLILHPDQEHLIFPLGCTVVLRNLIKRTQAFLQGHDNQVNCITVSKSGKLLASGQKTFMGFPADVIIWDFEQRKEIHRLSLHKVAVTSLSFSCDETYLATLGGQDDNSLVIWEVERGLAVCGTPAATDTAHCVRFFNNTEFSLVTGGNYHVVIWQFDLANKKLRPTQANLGQMKRITTNVLIDQEDKFVYCGTTTGDLLQVELGHALFKQYTPKGGPTKTFALGITTSALLPDGDMILGTGNGLLARVSADTLRVKQQCQVLGGVTSVALTQDGTHFFCGTTLSNIYWVDTDTLTAELRNTCHHERINQIAFPADYSEVFATCSVTDIRVWNAVTRQELLRIQVPNMECYCLDFMRDGKSIISGWSDGKVRAFLPQSGKLLYAINDAHKNGVTALALSSDCGRIVTGGMEGEVRVWNIGFQTQTMDASLKEHRGRVWCIKIAKDDTQAVSASADGSCIIWDLFTKTRKLCLFESTMFKSLVYHPDESQLLTTGSDRKVAYWDTFDGQAIRVLEGSEEGEITTLSVSKSGSHYVSGGEERLVKLWDYDKGVSEYIGVGHSGTITCAAISPDASFVVSAGSEGAILIWTMPQELVSKCNEAGLLLTLPLLAVAETAEMLAGVVQEHGDSGVIKVMRQPLPSPGPGEVQVQIAYAGVNFIDIYFREGTYASTLPLVPGLEGAGVVQSAGPGAEVWLGRRVAFVHKGAGAYAEFAIVPAARLVPLGSEVELRDAAAVLLQGLTAQYLVDDTIRLQRNDTVLVHAGAGGTGRLIIQVAKLRGLRVIATVSCKEKAAVAQAAGADEVIISDYTTFASEVLQMTQNKGVAAIYDGIGNMTFLQGFSCLQPRGGMVLFGASSGFPRSVNLDVLAKGSKSLVRPTLFDFIAQDAEL